MITKMSRRLVSAAQLLVCVAVLAIVLLVVFIETPARSGSLPEATITWNLSSTRLIRAIGLAGDKELEFIEGIWNCQILLPSGRVINDTAVLAVAASEHGQLKSLSIHSRDYTRAEVMVVCDRMKQWGLLASEARPRLDRWYGSVQQRRGPVWPIWKLACADLGELRLCVYVQANVALDDGYRIRYTLSWDK